jgi:hypothetical protein
MGQKYAAFDTSGSITAFYDSIDSPLPKGVTAIEITDEQWTECLSNPGHTVASGALQPPSEAELFKRATTAQKAGIDVSYTQALNQPIEFTTEANVTKTFDADSDSRTAVAQAAQSYTILGATPLGYYWKASDGTLVPFALRDLQGLNDAITSRVWVLFQQRTALKGRLASAKTLADVQAVKWS